MSDGLNSLRPNDRVRSSASEPYRWGFSHDNRCISFSTLSPRYGYFERLWHLLARV